MRKNSVADQLGREPGEYFIWSPPQKAVSVHLNLSVVDSLASEANEALGAMPKRGLEIGGLLLGRVRTPNPDEYIVAIEETEVVEIEHVRGPSYILSSSDREELFRRVRKHDKSKKGLDVVGFYRSHTRPGLFMDEYDFDLMRSYFVHPSSISLLIRPVHDGTPTAGFFFWEDGEMHRSSSYRDFPLQAGLLRSSRSTAPPDAITPGASPVQKTAAPLETKDVPDEGVPQTLTLVPKPRQTAQPPVQRVESKPFPDISVLLKTPALGWIAAAVLALVAVASLVTARRPADSVRPHNMFGMNVEPSNTGLRLTWNRSNPLIPRNRTAQLAITDGAEEKQLVLDATQLKTGELMYWPTSRDVNFRLQMGEFSESLRAVVPQLPLTREYAAAKSDPPAGPAASNESIGNATPAALAVNARSRSAEVKPAVLPGEPAASQAKAPELRPPAPAKTATAPVRRDPPPTSPANLSGPPKKTLTEVEPAKPSSLKRALGVIPGIFKKGEEDSLVPARAVRPVNPKVPAGMKLADDASVSVKVSLDENGRVKGTDLVSRNVDARLANAAMDAARRWRFEPARMQNKRVASAVVLHFRFSREGSEIVGDQAR